MRARLLELLRFGSVGLVAFVVDAGLFNLLRYGPGMLLLERPLTAKVVSVAVATLVAWLGNRYWTFSGRRARSAGRELVGFAAVNVGGMAIAVGCLAFSHYVLGLTSPLADNIAANVVGLGLGTAFRYVAYRHLVFTGAPPDLAAVAAEPQAASAPRPDGSEAGSPATAAPGAGLSPRRGGQDRPATSARQAPAARLPR